MIEEGQYLMFILMSPKNQPDEVEIFQKRMNNYLTKFPESPILKQGKLDLDNGPDAILNSFHEIAGITEDHLKLWEQNRNKIRSGELPVPFVMLEKLIKDTRDLFTTWYLANNTSEDKLEFKLNQAPQLKQERFDSEITDNKSLIIEDSSLLILSEIGVLDKFLEEIDEYFILESTFERINRNIHPLTGSIYSSIPHKILKSINKYKAKLRIISEDGGNPFNAIKKEIERNKNIFLTDDVNLLRLVSTEKGFMINANSFNVIEYLFNKSIIKEKEKYNMVSDLCSFGIHQPNMSIELLVNSLTFFTSEPNGIDYTDTGFKNIFDRVFSAQRNSVDVIKLFFRTLVLSSRDTNYLHNANTLLSLFRGLLIRHQYKSIVSFTAFWFINQCTFTKVNLESEIIPTSAQHVNFYKIYKEIIYKIHDQEVTDSNLLLNIVKQLFQIDEKSRNIAYQSISSCFLPLTDESEIFIKIYNEISINYQLMNSKFK
jgi:hypothetical protein